MRYITVAIAMLIVSCASGPSLPMQELRLVHADKIDKNQQDVLWLIIDGKFYRCASVDNKPECQHAKVREDSNLTAPAAAPR